MKPTETAEHALLEALFAADIADEITRKQLHEYGLMPEPAVSLRDAVAAALDEKQQAEGDHE